MVFENLRGSFRYKSVWRKLFRLVEMRSRWDNLFRFVTDGSFYAKHTNSHTMLWILFLYTLALVYVSVSSFRAEAQVNNFHRTKFQSKEKYFCGSLEGNFEARNFSNFSIYLRNLWVFSGKLPRSDSKLTFWQVRCFHRWIYDVNFRWKSSLRGCFECQGHPINSVLEIWVNCLLVHLLWITRPRLPLNAVIICENLGGNLIVFTQQPKST